jgi:tetratricopeptide (TPR) repeat protein
MTRSTVITLLAAGMVCCSVQAYASVEVVGGKNAPQCYQNAVTHGNVEAGIAVCKKALQEDSLNSHDRASTLVNLGVLQSRLSDSQAALASYDQALQADPSLAEAYINRSSVLISLQDYKGALDSANQALDKGAREPALAYYNRAVAEEWLNNITAAYADLKRAAALTPGLSAASRELRRFHTAPATSGGV